MTSLWLAWALLLGPAEVDAEVARAAAMIEQGDRAGAREVLLDQLPRATGAAHGQARQMLMDLSRKLRNAASIERYTSMFEAELLATEPGRVADEVERQDLRALVYLRALFQFVDRPEMYDRALQECPRSALRPVLRLFAAGLPRLLQMTELPGEPGSAEQEQARRQILAAADAVQALEPEYRGSFLGQYAATAVAECRAEQEDIAAAVALLAPYLESEPATDPDPRATLGLRQAVSTIGFRWDDQHPAAGLFVEHALEWLGTLAKQGAWDAFDRAAALADALPLDQDEAATVDLLRYARATGPGAFADLAKVADWQYGSIGSDEFVPFARAHPGSPLAPLVLCLAEEPEALELLRRRYPDSPFTPLAEAEQRDDLSAAQRLALYETGYRRRDRVPEPLRYWVGMVARRAKHAADDIAEAAWLEREIAPFFAGLNPQERRQTIRMLTDSSLSPPELHQVAVLMTEGSSDEWGEAIALLGNQALPLLRWLLAQPHSGLADKAEQAIRRYFTDDPAVEDRPAWPQEDVPLEQRLASLDPDQTTGDQLELLQGRISSAFKHYPPSPPTVDDVAADAAAYAGQPAESLIWLTYADLLLRQVWLAEAVAAYDRVGPGPFAQRAVAGRALAASEFQARQREPLRPVASKAWWPCSPLTGSDATLLGDTLVWFAGRVADDGRPNLAAFRRDDLRRVWEGCLPGLKSSAACADQLLVGGRGEAILIGADGRPIWRIEPVPGAGRSECYVALHPDGALLTCAGMIQRRDAATGALVWSRPVGRIAKGSPCRLGEVVMVAFVEPDRGSDGTLVGLDWTTGEERWRQRWTTALLRRPSHGQRGRQATGQPAVAEDGQVYVQVGEVDEFGNPPSDNAADHEVIDPATGRVAAAGPAPLPRVTLAESYGRLPDLLSVPPAPTSATRWIARGHELFARRGDGRCLRVGALRHGAVAAVGTDTELFVLDGYGVVSKYVLDAR